MRQILLNGAKEYGIELSENQIQKFQKYSQLLEEANKKMNLTAITGSEEIAKRHFLDSLALFMVCDFSGKRIIDVGTGAGFPGLPIKIACPEANVTLLDSQQKRVDFLQDVCDEMDIADICVHGRAEELGKEPTHRESFDYAVSRAVARLDILVELCLPLVKPGGRFLAMKAQDCDVEIKGAELGIAALGGKFLKTISYTVFGTEALRKIVVIEKIFETPIKYPRRYNKIQKSPIV